MTMRSNDIITSASALAASAALVTGLWAMPAFAQTTGTAASKNQASRVSTIIARSDTEITKRVTDLNNLNTRVQAMKNVSAAEKSTLQNEIQTNVSGLTALKATIDAGTDATTLRTEEKTIMTSFRIYALIVPQGYILAGADRINTLDGLMTTLAGKLQTRISQAQAAGHDVSALQSALSDLTAKVSDAGTQAQNAQGGVSSLQPDQGNQSVATSNHAALVAARGDIKTASQDLQAARKDANTIAQGLKGLKGSTSSATTQ